jgi:FtsH-binding integral membrane protein
MSIRNGLLQLIPLTTLIGSTTMANSTAFDGEKPTCEKYVLNTYLYLTIALSLVVTLTLFLNAVVPNYTMMVFSSFMIAIIVLIVHVILMFYLRYLINNVSALEVKKKTAIWLIFIINITLFVLPSLQLMIMQNQGGLIVSTLIITLALTSALSIIAFYKPELIQTKKWTPYLIVALLGMVLGYLIPIFTCLVGLCNNKFLDSWFYYLAILGVIIFCFVLLYYTKIVIENADKCKKPEDADYVKESTNLFMTIFNLFMNLLSARGRKRR